MEIKPAESDIMNEKLISELEQVIYQVKASRMKLCRYIATKEQCSSNFDERSFDEKLLQAFLSLNVTGYEKYLEFFVLSQ